MSGESTTYCFLPRTQRPCNDSCEAHTDEGCALLVLADTMASALKRLTLRRPEFRHPEPPPVGGG